MALLLHFLLPALKIFSSLGQPTLSNFDHQISLISYRFTKQASFSSYLNRLCNALFHSPIGTRKPLPRSFKVAPPRCSMECRSATDPPPTDENLLVSWLSRFVSTLFACCSIFPPCSSIKVDLEASSPYTRLDRVFVSFVEHDNFKGTRSYLNLHQLSSSFLADEINFVSLGLSTILMARGVLKTTYSNSDSSLVHSLHWLSMPREAIHDDSWSSLSQEKCSRIPYVSHMHVATMPTIPSILT